MKNFPRLFWISLKTPASAAKIAALALGIAAPATVSASAGDEACLDCHGASSAAADHRIPTGPHAAATCTSCHGASLEHRASPGAAAPGISFGPRWSASPALQDEPCLACHGGGVARYWDEALHMANNVTCISCHDLHVSENPLHARGGQEAVCTTCHKTQKAGIHGREKMLAMNPACTACHNPHADQRPKGVMLANDSAGCRRCHNSSSLNSDRATEKARSYHRGATSGEKTCIDCHVSIAHGDPDAFEPFMPLPRSERTITLFHPGKSDVDWLFTRHAGSQLLRQGTNCRQCHRGDEKELGTALGGPAPVSRQVQVYFRIDGGALVTSISWKGDRDDSSIAMMWGFGEDRALQRGGCWAACHGDMAGMSLDAGGGVVKYLWPYRPEAGLAGDPGHTRSASQLREAMQSGQFAELWRVDLQRSDIAVSALLAGRSLLDEPDVTGKVVHENGAWTVEISRPLSPAAPLLPIEQGRAYTFGVALHGLGRTGSDHWVSLPMTLSMDDEDTDFITD